MDSDQGKLFIGGISWETTEEKMKEYFQVYGDVLQTVVMIDKITGKPRGFGFVVFADPSVLDRVLQDTHVIDGRTVEAKRALSREEQGPKSGNVGSARSFGGGGNNRTKKIFVGGLPPTLTEDGFRTYFETYGNVTDVAIMFDQQTSRPRGFGFISFDSEDAVDRVLHKTFHDLSGKQVEVKRALPRDGSSGGRSTGNGGSGMGGGSYQGYGASGDNPSSYDRMDTNRYMQSQNTVGGYPPYGSSGYGTPGYGYGSSNNGMGYGAYGSYGGANPGYGAVNPGYGGPAVAAAFGNPNVPGAGYGSGQAGGSRSSWGSQGPSGYGNMGYGNASWGASNAGGGGGPANGGSAVGQSPAGATGYGNQGYGYGGYGGGDGAYGNPVGGSGASGDMQSGGGGYMGSGYGDASGNSQGSGNYGAQQNGPHGGQVGYGGGYGGAPSRQAQQH
ncbi:heterogene nuclear ribonucleoprotein 1 [Capsicum annuum]